MAPAPITNGCWDPYCIYIIVHLPYHHLYNPIPVLPLSIPGVCAFFRPCIKLSRIFQHLSASFSPKWSETVQNGPNLRSFKVMTWTITTWTLKTWPLGAQRMRLCRCAGDGDAPVIAGRPGWREGLHCSPGGESGLSKTSVGWWL